MMTGRARRTRAWLVSGMVATAAVVVGGGGPAPAQVGPPEPAVEYVDAFGPGIYEYVDCEGDRFTEADPTGAVFVELDDDAEADLLVSVSYSGDLAPDMVEAPPMVEIPAGESFGVAWFEVGAVEDGDLTVTVEPGPGYVADPDDTYTLRVSTTEPLDTLACEDLGSPPDGTDRQTIDVGERPLPLGFFVEDDEEPLPEPPAPPTSEPDTTTTTEPTTTTEDETTTSQGPTKEIPPTTDPPQQQVAEPFARLRAVRAVPDGWDTLVANGTLPPGLTYEDDVWSGAATTAGTYAFDVQVCLDQSEFSLPGGRRGVRRPTPRALPDVICFGYVDVEIAVLAADPAGPASPISADARFAG